MIVSTPQHVAVNDVRKALRFCEALHLSVLGVIENMSGFVCPHCGVTTDVFLSGGAEAMAADVGVPFLGRIPMDPAVVQAGERGIPHIEAFADSPTAAAFTAAIGPLLELTERPAPTRAVPVAGGAGASGPILPLTRVRHTCRPRSHSNSSTDPSLAAARPLTWRRPRPPQDVHLRLRVLPARPDDQQDSAPATLGRPSRRRGPGSRQARLGARCHRPRGIGRAYASLGPWGGRRRHQGHHGCARCGDHQRIAARPVRRAQGTRRRGHRAAVPGRSRRGPVPEGEPTSHIASSRRPGRRACDVPRRATGARSGWRSCCSPA